MSTLNRPVAFWSTTALAHRYARSLKKEIVSGSERVAWAELAQRAAEREVPPQSLFATRIVRHLLRFLNEECPQDAEIQRRFGADLQTLHEYAVHQSREAIVRVPQNRVYCHEGDQQVGSSLYRSYWLFGTQAHTDAAVIRPFRVAIEFDLQPTAGRTSWFKERLGKTTMHVLSGAYDAAVQVAIPVKTSRHDHDTYLTDKQANQDMQNDRENSPTVDPYTSATIQRLEGMGVYIALVPGWKPES